MKELCKKLFILFFLFISAISSLAQIQKLRSINPFTISSNPTNFIELNGEVYFVINGIEGFELWKYSDQSGIEKVFESPILYYQYSKKTGIQKSGNHIYFYKYQFNLNNQFDLYRVGLSGVEKIGNNINVGLIHEFGSKIILENFGIYEIKNYSAYAIFTNNTHKGVEFGYNNMYNDYFNSFIHDNSLFCFNFQPDLNGNIELKILKIETNDSIKVIDSTNGLVFNGSEYKENILTSDQGVFFCINKVNLSNFIIDIYLYKFDGTHLKKIKKIGNKNLNDFFSSQTYINIQSLINVDKNIAFIFDSKELWFSNGDSLGTYKVKSFEQIPQYESFNKIFSTLYFLKNKLFFAAKSEGDIELWASDGTTAGTSMLKNIYLNSSSHPHNFIDFKNYLFFRTSKDEIWSSDGSIEGTKLVIKIPREPDYIFRFSENYSYGSTLSGKVIFKNYQKGYGYEPWIFNPVSNQIEMISDINRNNEINIYSNQKVKMGNIWYFNGINQFGAELWRSDGTENGTYMVKDLNVGEHGTEIKEIIETDSLIYFIANEIGSKTDKLYVSDGTEAGTQEINLNINNENEFYLEGLTFSGNNIFIKTFSNLSGNLIKINKKTFYSVTSIRNLNNLPILPFNNGLLLIPSVPRFSVVTDAGINILDELFTNNNSVIYTSFKNDFLFFDTANLYVSNGTNEGTRIIKNIFSNPYSRPPTPISFYSTGNKAYLILLGYDETTPKIIIWSTNGTEMGTKFIGEFPAEGFIFNSIAVTHLDSTLIFSIMKTNFRSEIYSIKNDIVLNIFKKNESSNLQSEFILYKNQLYFTNYTSKLGTELYTTNGSIEGTYLVGEIESGLSNSKIKHLMNFENKLIFQGYNSHSGFALYQYIQTICEGNRNYAIKSGNWNDAKNWSCEHVPQNYDYVIIDNPYKIETIENQLIKIKQLYVKKGGVLNLNKGTVVEINPN